ncbi:MAG: hypothetical protein ACSLE2_06925 [Lysobacterales bacterium]
MPTKGYRLVATVEHLTSSSRTPLPDAAPDAAKTEHLRRGARWPAVVLAGVLLALVTIGYWLWRSDDSAVQSAPDLPTLAVLPFESVPATTENEYLANGLSEAVLNRLAGLGKLRVIGRTSSFSFKRSDYGVPRIARLLGVQYLLQGELRREGDRLHLNAELVDRDGFQVWSGTFTQAVGHENVTVQDDIVTAVATSLAPQLLPLPAGGMRTSFEAWQHYLIGHELLVRRPEGFARAARAQFDQAIAIDPGLANAYAERAIATLFQPELVVPEHNQTLLDDAWQDTDKALALNPDSAEAHAARGLSVQFRERRDNAAAEVSLRRALELNPYLVNAWNWLANVLEAQAREDEADEALQIAARIDPLAPTIGANLARREAQRGQFEAAEARLRRLMEVPQPGMPVVGSLMDLYLELGRLPEALAFARDRALRSVEQDGAVNNLGDLAWIHSMLGNWERVDYWRSRAEQAAGDESRTQYYWTYLELQFGYPGYARSVQNVEASLNAEVNAESSDLNDLPAEYRADYGALLALTGQFEASREILESLPEVAKVPQYLPDTHWVNVQHALAWAWLHTGEMARARALLTDLRQAYRRADDGGRLHVGSALFGYARNELLLSETGRALDLLEQAERAGWRDYYQVAPDPRWDAVRGEARFQALMARVKASIDAQRDQIEALAPDHEFIERLDATIRSSTGAK